MAITENLLFDRLMRANIDYVAKSVTGNTRVEIEFVGEFEGKAVLWDATIIALKPASIAQYIEVSEQTQQNGQLCLKLEVGLQVPVINEPTILKVIKMVRQYKNLQRGRHEFLGANK